MLLLLLVLLSHGHGQRSNLSCIIEGPEDRIVRRGHDASFSCVTNDMNSFWMIDGFFYSLPKFYAKPYPSFTLNKTTAGSTTYLRAIVQTNTTNREGEIICICRLAGAGDGVPNRRTAHWWTSCLAADEEDEVNTVTLSYHFNVSHVINSKIIIGVVQLQLPMVCHLETIYYSVVMEDASTHRNITTEGQTDFRGHDVRITTGRLEQNRTYRVYVKARALQVEEWHVLDQLDLDTSMVMVPAVGLCGSFNSTQSTRTTTYSLPTNTLSSAFTSPSLMISVVVLGVLLQLIITFVIVAVCGLLLHRKCSRIKSKPSRTMVTNPIYDGPMYESIHPQLRMVNSQNAAPTTGDSDSMKEGEEEDTTSEQERETSSTENEIASSDPPSSPRYLSHPKPCPQLSTQQLDTADISLAVIASTTDPIATQTQPKDRNVLGLILDLGGDTARGHEYGGPGSDNGRETRRRTATVAHSRPLLHSYFSSASSTPGEDDNYTVMSPVTHVPLITPDGTSFLKQQNRAYRDRCTTLI